MIKKIIYLMAVPLSPHEFVDFGLEYYLSLGLDVELWQCALFLNPSCQSPLAPKEGLGKINQSDFTSAKEAARALKNANSPHTLVINLLPRAWNTLSIFKALNLSFLQSVEVRTNALPLPPKKAIEKIRKITPTKLLTFILQKNIFWPRLAGKPKFIIYGGLVLRPQASEATHIISAHALDYDVFMKLCPCETPSPDERAEGPRQKIVFLDQCFPFHSDFLVLNCAPPATKECYYPSLASFFDLLEEKTEMDVVIAAHPRAPYADEDDYFGKREVIKGKSFSLVCGASLVLTHTSTAVNFAVMARTPVLLLSTNELERTEGKIIRFLGEALGSKVVNVDSPPPDFWPDFCKNSLLDINEEAYGRYFNKYIKEDGSPDLPFWQILLQKTTELAQGQASC